MHKDLAVWMAYEFFSQHDADAYDPDRADREAGEFTVRVGPRPSALELVGLGRERIRLALPHFV